MDTSVKLTENDDYKFGDITRCVLKNLTSEDEAEYPDKETGIIPDSYIMRLKKRLIEMRDDPLIQSMGWVYPKEITYPEEHDDDTESVTDTKSWKDAAGRSSGDNGYVFGDVTRSLITSLTASTPGCDDDDDCYENDENVHCDDTGYKFGDITRGIVQKLKETPTSSVASCLGGNIGWEIGTRIGRRAVVGSVSTGMMAPLVGRTKESGWLFVLLNTR